MREVAHFLLISSPAGESGESCARLRVWRELCNRCSVICTVGIGTCGIAASGLAVTAPDTSLRTLKNLLIHNLFRANFLAPELGITLVVIGY